MREVEDLDVESQTLGTELNNTYRGTIDCVTTHPRLTWGQVPERWQPYHFDIYGASHQIFHVAVIVAACIHFWGLMESFLVIRSATHACSQA